ncbi:TetR/AcrR family transcriptional regulator [Paractinoplanes toevensis]|uniref:TetR family transcriptional regulator n=1 Tax=Paractinoplanes toevensis TaxID=571911 RepID=A0A919WAP8_9ACTN|nr:TetR/AcrR family transcriptional regulator [Actinoplanes toevensis]GIM96710.1 TetR family transcriptional regulator [Actinoplanes toevensis]
MVSSKRGQARTDAILDAAMELVQEIGYGRVTIDAVAARAQASKMTIYQKWPGKADLIAAALRRQSESARPLPADTGSLRSDLLASVDGIIRSLSGERGPSLITLTEAMRADPALRDLIREQITDRCAADGTAICRRAADRAEIAATDLGPAALLLTVSHLFTAMLLNAHPPAADERAEFVDSVLLPMLGA